MFSDAAACLPGSLYPKLLAAAHRGIVRVDVLPYAAVHGHAVDRACTYECPDNFP